MSVRLFVGNLPYDATEGEIRDHFSSAGNVTNVFIPTDRETGRKRGFAFVEFDTAAGAEEAVRLHNNQPFKGRPLAVNEARARESRPAPGGPGGFRPGPPRPPMGGGGPPRPPMGGGPSRPFAPREGGFSRPDPGGMDTPGRDRPKRQFGPDAKPFRSRSQRTFKPESGKKAFKEKLGGQMYSMDDDSEIPAEEIDDFATSPGEGEESSSDE